MFKKYAVAGGSSMLALASGNPLAGQYLSAKTANAWARVRTYLQKANQNDVSSRYYKGLELPRYALKQQPVQPNHARTEEDVLVLTEDMVASGEEDILELTENMIAKDETPAPLTPISSRIPREKSIEDILADIRKLIAEDTPGSASTATSPAELIEPPQASEPLPSAPPAGRRRNYRQAMGRIIPTGVKNMFSRLVDGSLKTYIPTVDLAARQEPQDISTPDTSEARMSEIQAELASLLPKNSAPGDQPNIPPLAEALDATAPESHVPPPKHIHFSNNERKALRFVKRIADLPGVSVTRGEQYDFDTHGNFTMADRIHVRLASEQSPSISFEPGKITLAPDLMDVGYRVVANILATLPKDAQMEVSFSGNLDKAAAKKLHTRLKQAYSDAQKLASRPTAVNQNPEVTKAKDLDLASYNALVKYAKDNLFILKTISAENSGTGRAAYELYARHPDSANSLRPVKGKKVLTVTPQSVALHTKDVTSMLKVAALTGHTDIAIHNVSFDALVKIGTKAEAIRNDLRAPNGQPLPEFNINGYKIGEPNAPVVVNTAPAFEQKMVFDAQPHHALMLFAKNNNYVVKTTAPKNGQPETHKFFTRTTHGTAGEKVMTITPQSVQLHNEANKLDALKAAAITGNAHPTVKGISIASAKDYIATGTENRNDLRDATGRTIVEMSINGQDLPKAEATLAPAPVKRVHKAMTLSVP